MRLRGYSRSKESITAITPAKGPTVYVELEVVFVVLGLNEHIR